MKSIKHITLASLTCLLLWSCSDFLDNNPTDFIAEQNFYETQGQVLRAVNGLYGQMQPMYNAFQDEVPGNFYIFTEMRSDNTTYQFDAENRGFQQVEDVDEFLMSAENNWMNTTWNEMYSVILEANKILSNIDEVNFSDEALKDRSIGEAKFIRSLMYFHLVRLYGAIPLVTEPAATPDEAFTGSRTSVEDTYSFLLSELDEAEALLPDNYSSSDAGRVTRGAVLTLLGDIYLTRKNYDQAIASLEQVTELGYSLVNNYEDIYLPSNKNNVESIFEIQYNGSQNGEESTSIFVFAPIAAPNVSTLFPFPNSGGGFGFNIPTRDIINTYEDGDEREDASIAYYTDPETADYSVAIGDSIPFIKKYYHPSTYPGPGRATENQPVYRYAHVLLMLSEAYNEQGQSQLAYQYVNQVRNRAGLEPLAGLSQAELRDAIYKEERLELAFENHRWFNLLRTGRAQEVMQQHGQEIIASTPRLNSSAYNIQPYKLLYPIPLREVRLNQFEQNQGW